MQLAGVKVLERGERTPLSDSGGYQPARGESRRPGQKRNCGSALQDAVAPAVVLSPRIVARREDFPSRLERRFPTGLLRWVAPSRLEPPRLQFGSAGVGARKTFAGGVPAPLRSFERDSRVRWKTAEAVAIAPPSPTPG